METMTVAYRLSAEVKQKIQELLKSEKLSADALFTALLSEYKATKYGQGMESNLDAWAMHSAALQQLYTESIRSGIDSKSIVQKEMSGQIKAAEEAIQSLREKLDEKIYECEVLTKGMKEASVQIDKLEIEAKRTDNFDETIANLNKQMNDYKEKAMAYDGLKKKYDELKNENVILEKTNQMQEQIMNKFLKG